MIKNLFKNFKNTVGLIKKKKEENEAKLSLPLKKGAVKKSDSSNCVKIEFSILNVTLCCLAILSLFLGVYFVYLILGILILFFLAFFIAAALDPLIDKLERAKIPRPAGILIVYVIFFVLAALFIANLLPLLANQLLSIVGKINEFVIKISNSDYSDLPFAAEIGPYLKEFLRTIDVKVIALQLKDSLQLISSQILSLGSNLWTILMAVTNGMMNLLLVLILVFFMTVDEKAIRKFCISIVPSKYSPYMSNRLEMVKEQIGHWIRGQLMVCLISGIVTYIGLVLLGVEYALTHSVICAIFMVVPVFGRMFAWLISAPIILSQSPALALAVTIYYLIISQFENNYLFPYLMNKAVGLNPIVIIFALMIGSQFLGVLGLVLAIPIATILAIFLKDLGAKLAANGS